PGLVQTAVAPHQEVREVLGVDPQRVVVHVLVLLPQLVEALPAVLAHLEVGVHGEDAIGVPGIHEDLLVVLGRAGDVVAALLPAPPPVGGAEEAAGLGPRLHHRVAQAAPSGRGRQADAADVGAGQASVHLAPGLPPVGGLVDASLGPAVDHRPHVAAA